MTKIHFVGSIHTDLKGQERLENALLLENPDTILVECPTPLFDFVVHDYAKYIQDNVQKTQFSQLDSQNLALLQKCLGSRFYEIRIAHDYSINNNKKIYPVDDGETANVASIKTDVQLLSQVSEERIVRILESFKEEYNEQQYANDRLCYLFEDKNPMEQFAVDSFIQELYNDDDLLRDEIMEQNIRNIIKKENPTNLLIIIGSLHGFRDDQKRTLFSRLEDFNPTRKLLCDYD